MEKREEIDPKLHYSIGPASKLIGCSKWALKERIRTGTVLASRLPKSGKGHTWVRIAGEELLRFKGQILLNGQPLPPIATAKKAARSGVERAAKALAEMGLGPPPATPKKKD